MTDHPHACALKLLMQSCAGGEQVGIAHYLYFATEQAGAEAAVELRNHGFRTEERPGADGVSWLVLARQDVVPSEKVIAHSVLLLEDLTRRRAGEYDGWEAEVETEKLQC